MQGILLHDGRWSKGYKIGSSFFKYFNYKNEDALLREVTYSNLAYTNAINTPKVLSHGYDKTLDKLYIEYSYKHNQNITVNNNFLYDICHILNKMKSIQFITNTDTYWNDKLLVEFEFTLKNIVLSSIKLEFFSYDKCILFLKNLECKTFIHGDFSLDNIFLSDGKITIVDFQHSCIGPENWDLSYLLATIDLTNYITKYIQSLNIDIQILIYIISLIRLGRSIRKNENIKERYEKCILLEKLIFKNMKESYNESFISCT